MTPQFEHMTTSQTGSSWPGIGSASSRIRPVAFPQCGQMGFNLGISLSLLEKMNVAFQSYLTGRGFSIVALRRMAEHPAMPGHRTGSIAFRIRSHFRDDSGVPRMRSGGFFRVERRPYGR